MSFSTDTPEVSQPQNGGKSINIQSSVKWQAYNGGKTSALQGDCACSLTRRAARSVTQLYDLVLAPTGMKATQFVLLRAIADGGLIAQWQLGRDLSIAVETLTRRLATMRRAGWVELHSGSDKREHLYSITDSGREKLDSARSYWQRAEERLHEQLGDDGWRETSAVLDRLAVAADRSLSARMKNVARS
ncbi:MAG TPA: MarR family winged helix-turn-helix transcriptional regulator [Terriglobales bacterium]|nr:MarR family winged helix-turn-helix transcriptional regulator [Terriglobales bacterium]